MAGLNLTLLGGFQGRLGAGPPLTLPTRKAQALLAFLALPPGRSHPREKLAFLLWGGVPEPQARRGLRQALFTIRKAVATKPPVLLVAADTIALNPSCIDVDVVEFERWVAEDTPAALERASALYRGELLEGLALQEAPFEEWLLAERERLRELALEALAKLLRQQRTTGATEAALQTARRLLALDPLQEPVHRSLMRLYAQVGRRAAALRQYQVCVGTLQRELGVEPEATTKRLYQEILRQRPMPSTTNVESPETAPLEAGRSPDETVSRDLPLIGREAEMQRLREVLDQVLTGHEQVVAVIGEAGIGKSRLLAEIAVEASARRGRVLIGRCYEAEQVLPFGPWVDALRAAQLDGRDEILESLNPFLRAELARLLPELGREPAPGVGDHRRLFESVAQLVRLLALQQPLMLILEDLHWADEMSLRLLSFLGRRLRASSTLVVGTAREEDLARAPVLRRTLEDLVRDQRLLEMRLAALSKPDTLALVRTLARTQTDEAVVTSLAEQIWIFSEGNPFVVIETLRSLPKDATPQPLSKLAVPQRVRETIVRHLEELSEGSRELAAVAAVIGREFDFPLLQRSAGFEERQAAALVEELVRRRLMSAVGEGFDFTHDRIRRIVYDELLEPRRRAIHAAVGEALEALHADHLAEVYDRLAHHYMQAAVAEKAVTYLARFGDLARRRYAHADALRALDQALPMVEQLPSGDRDRRHLQIVLDKAWALSMLARFQEVINLLSAHRAQLEALGDPALAGPFFFRLGLTHAFLSHRDEALEAVRRSRDEAERASDDAVTGQAHYALMLISHWWDTPAEGIVQGDRAVPLLEKAGRQDWLGLTHAVRAMCHHTVGNFEQALTDAVRGEAIGASQDESRVQNNAAAIAAFVHATREDWEAALACAQRAIDVARDPYAAAVARAYLGIVALERGEAANAVAALAEAVEGLRRFGNLAPASRLQGQLAEAYRRAGDSERARRLALEVVDLSRTLGTLAGRAWAERTLGRIAIGQGTVDEAESRLAAALEAFASVPVPFEAARTHLDLAETAHRRGDAAIASDHLAQAADGFARLRLPTWLARTTALARQLGVPSPVPAAS